MYSLAQTWVLDAHDMTEQRCASVAVGARRARLD
jgi:hypothetical protein